MIIVADTTPIHYLSLIGEVEVLKKLFGRIIIPRSVLDEMQRDRTPRPVKDWISSQPSWLEVKQPSLELNELAKSLGKEERDAISLAIELEADALLLDDKRAKNEARRETFRSSPFSTCWSLRPRKAGSICLARFRGFAKRISTFLLKM